MADPQSPLRRWTAHIAIASLALAAYVGSYVALSLQGRFEPTIFGLGYAKSYDWMPAGFYDPEADPPRKPLLYIYLPLWLLDRYFWHTEADLEMERYPVNWWGKGPPLP
jgi:hypothetical protein